VFTAVALLSIAQLATRWDDIEDRAGVGLHAAMAGGMAAMSLPGPGPFADSAWAIAFAATGSWALAALWRRAQAARRASPGQRSWAPTGSAAHHLLGSVVMLVAFGIGHGAHTTGDVASASPIAHAAPSGEADAGAGAGAGADEHDGHGEDGAGHGGAGRGDATAAGLRLTPAVDDAVRTAATWPAVWPLAGVGFLAYGAWSVRGGADAPACRHCAARAARARVRLRQAPRRTRLAAAALGPVPTRAAAVAMAGGMATMAFAL
jgi:hypothetical protein